MLRNCGCFQRARRNSSFEDSSSCRSSEIERGGEMTPHSGSLLKLFTSKGWCRQWRKSGRGMSMTKIERSKYKSQLMVWASMVCGKFSSDITTRGGRRCFAVLRGHNVLGLF
uniref:Uncharacterized protein n=1 Tax=Anopheles albimanus TaxID=7167 RepID=A0A182FTV5_ANOAL